MNRNNSSAGEAASPWDKATLLEPASLLTEQLQLSVKDVHDLWQRTAQHVSPLLCETNTSASAPPDAARARDTSAPAVATSPDTPVQSVAALLAQAKRAAHTRITTSLPTLDAALGGGFSPGLLVELSASPASSATTRRLAQRWGANTLRPPSTSTSELTARGTVYWLSASAGAVLEETCVSIATAGTQLLAGDAAHVFPIAVSDLEALESDVLGAVQEHRQQERWRHQGSASRCLLVVDDLTALVHRSFPAGIDVGGGAWRVAGVGDSREEVFAMHAILQRTVDSLKAFAETHEAVCVVLTEQSTSSAGWSPGVDETLSTEDGTLSRAFEHAMNLRLAVRDGLWCVQRYLSPPPARRDEASACPSSVDMDVGPKTELRVVKSAVCVHFTLLASITVDSGVIRVDEIDALLADATGLYTGTPRSFGESLPGGVRTQLDLLVSENFLASVDGWDHMSRPRFMIMDC